MVCGAVAPLIVNQASADPRFARHPGLVLFGIESYIAVPLRLRGGACFGTLCALDPLPAELTEAALEIFQLLADLIAFELEADERQREREAERARIDRLRQEVLDGVAHDLRAPLATVSGEAQLLRRRVRKGNFSDPSRLDEGLGLIAETAHRMARQIDEIVDVARLRSGQDLPLRVGPTDLVGLVRQVAETYQRTSDRHHLKVDAEPESLVGAWDGDRLERVVANLVDNAIKYSPVGGEVSVEVGLSPDCRTLARLAVTDPGIGIPAADLPHVFSRFHRGANAADRFEGAGLGLAGAKRIVDQHGGTMTVRSEEGRGTSVTVLLPLIPPPPSPRPGRGDGEAAGETDTGVGREADRLLWRDTAAPSAANSRSDGRSRCGPTSSRSEAN